MKPTPPNPASRHPPTLHHKTSHPSTAARIGEWLTHQAQSSSQPESSSTAAPRALPLRLTTPRSHSLSGPLTLRPTVRLAGPPSFGSTDSQPHRLSAPPTFGPADFRARRLSGPPTFGPADFRARRLSGPPTFGPADFRARRLSGPPTFSPTDSRARCTSDRLTSRLPPLPPTAPPAYRPSRLPPLAPLRPTPLGPLTLGPPVPQSQCTSVSMHLGHTRPRAHSRSNATGDPLPLRGLLTIELAARKVTRVHCRGTRSRSRPAMDRRPVRPRTVPWPHRPSEPNLSDLSAGHRSADPMLLTPTSLSALGPAVLGPLVPGPAAPSQSETLPLDWSKPLKHLSDPAHFTPARPRTNLLSATTSHAARPRPRSARCTSIKAHNSTHGPTDPPQPAPATHLASRSTTTFTRNTPLHDAPGPTAPIPIEPTH